MPKEDPFVNRAQLLKAIKKYPEIWDSNNKLHMCRSVTAPMWNEIADQFGGHVPTGKLMLCVYSLFCYSCTLTLICNVCSNTLTFVFHSKLLVLNIYRKII